MSHDQSIPGGAYLGEDGQTWHDADGVVLDEQGQKDAQALSDKNAHDLANAESARVAHELKSRNVVYVQAQPAPVVLVDDSVPSGKVSKSSKS
jgi:hypothetical protein